MENILPTVKVANLDDIVASVVDTMFSHGRSFSAYDVTQIIRQAVGEHVSIPHYDTDYMRGVRHWVETLVGKYPHNVEARKNDKGVEYRLYVPAAVLPAFVVAKAGDRTAEYGKDGFGAPVPLRSSWLAFVAYNSLTHVALFRNRAGKEWAVRDVSPSAFFALLRESETGGSVGAFYNQHIRKS